MSYLTLQTYLPSVWEILILEAMSHNTLQEVEKNMYILNDK